MRGLRHRPWAVWLWPAVGLAALIWFLLRVVPKPSRASYPCQRVAAPMAVGFLAWVAGALGSILALHRARQRLRQGRLLPAALCLLACLLAATWAWVHAPARPAEAFTPSDPPNTPIGVAKGIHPGRVVWVHDPDATDWDGSSERYWYDTHTDQDAVDRMLSRSVRWLAGRRTDAEAWDALFRAFNQAHGKGDVGYQAGEKVTIKINLNNCGSSHTDSNNRCDTSPQITRALLRQLVLQAGVPQARITVYDSVRYVADKIYVPCHGEFPDVRFEDTAGGSGRYEATKDTNAPIDYAGTIPTDCVPTCCSQAAYLINAAALKGHSLAAVTLCAKNHFGSLCETPSPLHDSVDTTNNGMASYTSLVELMGHEHLDGKCLLFVIDGLWGAQYQSNNPVRWGPPLFNNDWPSSLLVSQDGVAVDSVAVDFLRTQFASIFEHADNYLHEAALAGNPPSGTVYDPEGDGMPLTSLGVHEHWNDATDRQYTRNLGTGDGIELLALTNAPPTVDAGLPQTLAVGAWASLDGSVSGGRLGDASGPVTTAWTPQSGPGLVTFADETAVDTAATFAEEGTYVLRLTATDGALQAHDDVTITVLPVCTPGDLLVDTQVWVAGRLHLNGPAPTSLGVLAILLHGNATTTRFAVKVESGPVNGWLEIDGSVIRPTGQAEDWHTAGEWEEKRLVGLVPGVEYTFSAQAEAVSAAKSDLVEVGVYSTNEDCDVNCSGMATGLDYAFIKAAILFGSTMGVDQPWAGDVNGDGLISDADLNATMERALAPVP